MYHVRCRLDDRTVDDPYFSVSMVSHIHGDCNHLDFLLPSVISIPMQYLMRNAFRHQVRSCPVVSQIKYPHVHSGFLLELL